jgi:DNA-binding NtrC family response regulator
MPPDPRPRVLIIDDEIKICLNCVKILSNLDLETDYALNGQDALQKLETEAFDIVITDLKMSRLGGMEVLRRIKESWPDIFTIVITGYASVSSAVEVMKMGAFDYLPKPFTPEELRSVVRQTLNERMLQRQSLDRPRGDHVLKPFSHQLIGNSPKIQKVITMVAKVAPTDATVLIHGESGTGKELIARAIHANSQRSRNVFFAVDCATLSGNLLESELFGHKRGAFTGAYQDKAGIIERADGGTVFLDEIGNISLAVQAKLLRFLETREFLPLGAAAPRKVDLRLILATNQDLKAMVLDGTFRDDFYYRIFVYPIIMPPLRERPTDIMAIAHHFLDQYTHRLAKTIRGFDPEAIRRLTQYDWPGNVRQLKNMIERAAILCETEQITLKELNFPGDGDPYIQHIPQTNDDLKRLKKEIRQKAVQGLEKNFILNALVRTDWNVTRAADSVGLQRTNFQTLMRKYNVKRPRAKKANQGH